MSHSFSYNDTMIGVGDTVDVTYKVKEGDKERNQIFAGIVIKVRGASPANRMITVRKIARSGTGVERIIPLASPFLADIKVTKKSNYSKSRLFFIRNLSQKKTRHKLYRAT